MTYEEWEQEVHQRVKNEPVWDFFGYRKALFVYGLVWKDCEKLNGGIGGRAIVDQIIRSAGSISANVEEGYGRGYGKEYVYFYESRSARPGRQKAGTGAAGKP